LHPANDALQQTGGLYNSNANGKETPQGGEMEERNRNMPQKKQLPPTIRWKNKLVNAEKFVVRTTK